MCVVKGGFRPSICVLVLGWSVIGCGSPAGDGGDGGGLTNEGGTNILSDAGRTDGGGVSDDAGVDLDADIRNDDAGRVSEDGGTMLDAGTMGDLVDAGPDASVMMGDAGPGTDAGPGMDAGSDAGTDAGFDAGPPPMCATDRDCLPRVGCTSPTRLTTQTYSCSRGFCIEDRPTSVDCAAGDVDTCSRDSVVSTRGTCDAATQACVSRDVTSPCAADMCDASSNHVTETCVASGATASCVASTAGCRTGTLQSCSSATLSRTTRGCSDSAGCTVSTSRANYCFWRLPCGGN